MSNKNGKAETIVLKKVVRLTVFQNIVGMVKAYEEEDTSNIILMFLKSVYNSEGMTRVNTNLALLKTPQMRDSVRESIEEENLRAEHEDEKEMLISEGEALKLPTEPEIT